MINKIKLWSKNKKIAVSIIVIIFLLGLISCFMCHHENTTEISLKVPTCTECGEYKIVCDDCGDVVATGQYPKLGHDWKKTKTITEPTCGESGKAECVCKNCGLTKTRNIEATQKHEYGNEITGTIEDDIVYAYHSCKVCGDLEPVVLSAEEINAINSAQSYQDIFHMSKNELYDQLTSEYGDGFSDEAASTALAFYDEY